MPALTQSLYTAQVLEGIRDASVYIIIYHYYGLRARLSVCKTISCRNHYRAGGLRTVTTTSPPPPAAGGLSFCEIAHYRWSWKLIILTSVFGWVSTVVGGHPHVRPPGSGVLITIQTASATPPYTPDHVFNTRTGDDVRQHTEHVQQQQQQQQHHHGPTTARSAVLKRQTLRTRG